MLLGCFVENLVVFGNFGCGAAFFLVMHHGRCGYG